MPRVEKVVKSILTNVKNLLADAYNWASQYEKLSSSEEILNENTVFTVEPGIYLPGFGGVRIEDMVVLQKDGPRILTASSKELIKV